MTRTLRCAPLAAAAAMILAFAGPAWAISFETTIVDTTVGGEIANFNSYHPAISADARYVAFYSVATNLVPDDTNGVYDVFVKDRDTGDMTRASVSTSGNQGNRASREPLLSADGRYVVFQSFAATLVPGDSNAASDIFMRDMQAGTTTRISVSSSGGQADGSSYLPHISADGRYVVYYSAAGNLVSDDTNGLSDIFLYDSQTAQTTRVSTTELGAEGNGASQFPSISADGRYVSFNSGSTNLVASDINARNDIFVKDTLTGTVELVSVATDGRQAVAGSTDQEISGDGRHVVFVSKARNLVAGDTNQKADAFVHDRETGVTTRVSVSTTGTETNADVFGVNINSDGRYAFFHTPSPTLFPGDNNFAFDIFRHDLQTSETEIVSRAPSGAIGDKSSHFVSPTPDGSTVAYHSDATNLVPDDPTVQNIFVTEVLP